MDGMLFTSGGDRWVHEAPAVSVLDPPQFAIISIGCRAYERVWISTVSLMPSCVEDLRLGSIKYFLAGLSKHLSFFDPDGGNPMELEFLHESLGFLKNPKG